MFTRETLKKFLANFDDIEKESKKNNFSCFGFFNSENTQFIQDCKQNAEALKLSLSPLDNDNLTDTDRVDGFLPHVSTAIERYKKSRFDFTPWQYSDFSYTGGVGGLGFSSSYHYKTPCKHEKFGKALLAALKEMSANKNVTDNVRIYCSTCVKSIEQQSKIKTDTILATPAGITTLKGRRAAVASS